MKSLTKNQRNRVILVALCTAAVLAGIVVAMIIPQRDNIASVTQRIAEQRSKNENAQRLVTSTDQLQHDLEAAAQKLKAAEGEMASGDMYSWVIQTVNKFREGYKVEIPQFSREVACEVGVFPTFPYKAVLFNVRGTAYFHDFGRFLADFENRFPYLRVQNLELEPAAGSAANSPPGTAEPSEKLAFRMAIVALVNPQSR